MYLILFPLTQKLAFTVNFIVLGFSMQLCRNEEIVCKRCCHVVTCQVYCQHQDQNWPVSGGISFQPQHDRGSIPRSGEEGDGCLWQDAWQTGGGLFPSDRWEVTYNAISGGQHGIQHHHPPSSSNHPKPKACVNELVVTNRWLGYENIFSSFQKIRRKFFIPACWRI